MEKNSVDPIRLEEDALDQSIALNKIVVDLLEERKRQSKQILLMLVGVSIVFMVALFVNYKEKLDMLQQLENTRIDFMEYLDSIEYVTTETSTTTTTQTVEGDSAQINNVEGDQYNDQAVHNTEGGE